MDIEPLKALSDTESEYDESDHYGPTDRGSGCVKFAIWVIGIFMLFAVIR
jgi:hypothetical protein